MIRIRELDHVVLRVSDMQQMIDFYCTVLGCTLEKRQENRLIGLGTGVGLDVGELGAEELPGPVDRAAETRGCINAGR